MRFFELFSSISINKLNYLVITKNIVGILQKYYKEIKPSLGTYLI